LVKKRVLVISIMPAVDPPSNAPTTFYLPAYNFSIDASAASITSMIDEIPSATLIYQIELSASVSHFDEAFMFQVDASDILLFTQGNVGWNSSNPSIADASFISGAYHQINVNKQPELYMDYLTYIADYELGSKYLVGAFNNVQDITDSIQINAYNGLTTTVNADLNGQFSTSANAYRIPDFAGPRGVGSKDASGVWMTDLSGTALWSVFEHVFQNLNDRISEALQNGANDGSPGTPKSLLRVGDTIQVQLTVQTPPLDNSILNFGDTSNSAGVKYTPLRPPDITYLLNIHLTA